MTTADGLIGVVGAIVAGRAPRGRSWRLRCSPLAPLGPVRPVYPFRGIAFDWTVLGLGALVLVVVLERDRGGLRVPAGSAPASRAARRWSRCAARGAARVAAAAALPVPGVSDAACASRSNRGAVANAVPVRSAILGAALAIVVVVEHRHVRHQPAHARVASRALRLELGLRAERRRRRRRRSRSSCPTPRSTTTTTSRLGRRVLRRASQIDGLSVPVIGGSPNAAGRPAGALRPRARRDRSDRARAGDARRSCTSTSATTVAVEHRRRRPARAEDRRNRDDARDRTGPEACTWRWEPARSSPYQLIPAAAPRHRRQHARPARTRSSCGFRARRRTTPTRSARSSGSRRHVEHADELGRRRWWPCSIPAEIVNYRSMSEHTARARRHARGRARSSRSRSRSSRRYGADGATSRCSRHSGSPAASSRRRRVAVDDRGRDRDRRRRSARHHLGRTLWDLFAARDPRRAASRRFRCARSRSSRSARSCSPTSSPRSPAARPRAPRPRFS